MIKFLIGNKAFRRRVIFHLKHNFFHELNHSIPVRSGYWVHLCEQDSFDSFSEIFVQDEYLSYLPNEPISRLVDIGANHGFFSLWLQSLQPNVPLKSCLIEPSKICRNSLKNLSKDPKIAGRFNYIAKAIGNPSSEVTNFYDRPYMSGSTIKSQPYESLEEVEILKQNDISKWMPPPYDLIKCDIEGAEWELLNHYDELVSQTKYILLEWHSWHNGGGGLQAIINKITNLGFNIVKQSDQSPAVGRKGTVGILLASKTK